jgi:hypothetical protein
MPMTPEAKTLLSRTIRQLRETLIERFEGALRGEYQLGIAASGWRARCSSSQPRDRKDPPR